jgi:hypothetical protein
VTLIVGVLPCHGVMEAGAVWWLTTLAYMSPWWKPDWQRYISIIHSISMVFRWSGSKVFMGHVVLGLDTTR